MASGGRARDAEYALSKLLPIGTVAEYHNEFEIFINRVTGISQSLFKSCYIFGLKLELQRELLRTRPTTLGGAFSVARIDEAHYEDERPTIAIAKTNDLTARVQVKDLEQTTQGRGGEPNRFCWLRFITCYTLLLWKFYIKSSLLMGMSRKLPSFRRLLSTRYTNLEELQLNQDENICYYWENCYSILNADEADNSKPSLSADTFGNNRGDDSENSDPVTSAEEVVDIGHSSTLPSSVEHESPRVIQL
ncbi:hypothetical protein Tco_0345153 [Tanacetum coccineum]